MDCNECGSFVAEGETFCRRCGTPLGQAPTGNLCVRCKKQVQNGLKFCNYCGMPMDGSGICVVCKEIIPVGTDFCARCGARTDGKIQCQNCNTLLERNTVFCGNCGTQQKPQQQVRQSAKPSYAKESAKYGNYYGNYAAANDRKIRGGSIKDGKAYKLVKTWMITGILLLSFIFSYFAFSNIKIQVKEGEQTINIEIKGSPFKAIEALTHIGDEPEDYQQMNVEFFAELFQKSMEQADKKVINLKLDYNYLNIMAAEAGGIKVGDEYIFRPDAPKILLLVAQAVLPVVMGILCLVFFIISLVQSIKATTGNTKTSDRKDIFRLSSIFGLLITSLILSKISVTLFSLASYGMDMTVSATLNGFGVTIAVFTMFAVIALIACHFIFTAAELNILKLISHGVSIILFGIILGALGAVAVKVKQTNFLMPFGKIKFSVFWTYFINSESFFAASESMTNIGYAVSALSLVVFALLLAFAVTSLSSSLARALKPELRANGKTSILLLVFSAILVAFTIVGIILLNGDLDEALFSISAWPIVITVLCIINLIQSFVFANIIEKNKSKIPARPDYY